MLRKVISGGQTGADQAGIIAAQFEGFETGGWAPKGFRTLSGRCDWLADYGLKEHPSRDYPPRTARNVQESDGTMRFAGKWCSAGELCTLKAIKANKKPYLDVDIYDPPTIEEAAQWILDTNIEVLNVAGNSEQTCPGIENWVVAFLCPMFYILKNNANS